MENTAGVPGFSAGRVPSATPDHRHARPRRAKTGSTASVSSDASSPAVERAGGCSTPVWWFADPTIAGVGSWTFAQEQLARMPRGQRQDDASIGSGIEFAILQLGEFLHQRGGLTRSEER